MKTKLPIVGGILVVAILLGAAAVYVPKWGEKMGKAAVSGSSKEVKKVENDIVAVEKNNPVAVVKDTGGLEDRMASMEAQLASLQTQVTQLSKNSKSTTVVQQQTAASSSPLPPQFIPLGDSSNTPQGVTTWQTLPTPTITINSESYPGYVSAQLQMNLLVFQGNGTALVRLVDMNSGSVVPFSTVQSTSFDYTFVSSSPFQLFPGAHTYGFQVLTTTGYPVQFASARLQINFF